MGRTLFLVANYDWVIYNFRLPLIDFLQAEGIDVTLVCPPGEYSDKFIEGDYDWIPWKLNRRSVNPGTEAVSIYQLFRIYQDHQPDAVHHITIKPILYGSMAAKRAGIRLVINNFTGLGFLFSKSTGATWLRRATLPILRRALPGHGFYTVVLNESDRQSLLDYQLMDPDKTVIVPGDGVDVRKFYPVFRLQESQQTLIVIMAARLLWDKGVSEYVEAAAQIKEEFPDVKFWLAGERDPGNPASIPEDQVKKWKEEQVVELLGHQSDMPDLLRRASIAVLPSYHEGLPMFLLESAASGLPLVASDIPGCRQVVDPDINGLLFPPGNAEALAEAVKKLLADPQLRLQMGKQGREKVQQAFSQQVVLEQFEKL